MAIATWGRSLATRPPDGPVGDERIPPAAPPPAPVPGILSMYPGCTLPPRNMRTYKAACAAANGELVKERDAFEVKEGMRAWCCGHFLTVVEARHMRVGQINDPSMKFLSEDSRNHPFVLLRLEGDDVKAGWIIGDLDTPVYCLA